MTTVSAALPQGVPKLATAQAPSKLPPPLPPAALFRDARRGSSAAGLLRRAGVEGSIARGASREPDSDFSSLPILPPALPDCARAMPGNGTVASVAESRAALTTYRKTLGILGWLPTNGVLAAGPIGTHRADDAASFASPAAIVKRRIFSALNGLTLNQRP